MAAAGFVVFLPAIASTGVLGEEAAATTSNNKRLAKWEREIRGNINTEYLVLEDIGRIYIGESEDEELRDRKSASKPDRVGRDEDEHADSARSAAPVAARPGRRRVVKVSFAKRTSALSHTPGRIGN